LLVGSIDSSPTPTLTYLIYLFVCILEIALKNPTQNLVSVSKNLS